MDILAYERLTEKIFESVRLKEGEHLLVRRPFRWLLDGAALPNAYETCDVGAALALGGLEIIESYGEHIHIVRKKTITGSTRNLERENADLRHALKLIAEHKSMRITPYYLHTLLLATP